MKKIILKIIAIESDFYIRYCFFLAFSKFQLHVNCLKFWINKLWMWQRNIYIKYRK